MSTLTASRSRRRRKGNVYARTLLFCLVHGYNHSHAETVGSSPKPDNLLCRTEPWPLVTLDHDEFAVVSDEPAVEAEPEHTLYSTDFAYIWSMQGPVPCQVIEVVAKAHRVGEAVVRITAARPGWMRGSVRRFAVPNPVLVSREQVHIHRGEPIIRGQVRFCADNDGSFIY